MADFISGKHTTTKLQLDDDQWVVKVKSTKVQELGEVVQDQVNGELRARFQKLTDGYIVTLGCYNDGSSNIIENYIKNQQNEDANEPQLALAAGITFKYLDGTSGGFVFRGCTLGIMDFEASGRKERNMHTVVFYAQYFEEVPTAA